MNPVFADAGYWIAFLFESDFLHEAAVRVGGSVAGRPVITSELVLTELLDGAASRGAFFRATVARFIDTLPQTVGVRVVPMSSQLFQEAYTLYKQRMDKAWGLTDCTSIVICRQEGITDVLAHDRHFEQAGFRALLRDNV